jgi:hypothetical protein
VDIAEHNQKYFRGSVFGMIQIVRDKSATALTFSETPIGGVGGARKATAFFTARRADQDGSDIILGGIAMARTMRLSWGCAVL